MGISRRSVIFASTSALLCLSLFPAAAQAKPIALRLVRRTGWEELLGRNQCVIGDLYLTDLSFPLADAGTKISNALELAYRNDLSEISSIPKGDYEGFIRTNGPRGWRIELTGTGSRSNIQLHVGNRPADTIGCILPGTGNSTDSQCQIAGSKQAMDLLRAVVGANEQAKVVLRIS